MTKLTRARQFLNDRFGYTDFRPRQAHVIEATLADRDVLAVLPTGYGKSVCFQIPAALRDGTTLVVSPLVSLIEDQVKGARRRGLTAFGWTQGASKPEVDRALRAAARGELDLLYVSPERLGQGSARARLRETRVSGIAVDEAHCVSQWGHEFRPSYLEVGGARRALGMPPVLALTATATAQTRREIERLLEIRSPVRVLAPADRPNLFWRVEGASRLEEAYVRIKDELLGRAGAAVVYAPTRELSARLAIALSRRGFSAAAYHAGLPLARRSKTQAAFLSGKLRVVCATTAFGMGIDHPSVRLVAHLGVPPSMEAYVQEAGRAGRDGAAATCLLVSVAGRRGRRLPDTTLRARARRAAMLGYVDTRECRRAAIAAYFDEPPPRCAGCDNCD